MSPSSVSGITSIVAPVRLATYLAGTAAPQAKCRHAVMSLEPVFWLTVRLATCQAGTATPQAKVATVSLEPTFRLARDNMVRLEGQRSAGWPPAVWHHLQEGDVVGRILHDGRQDAIAFLEPQPIEHLHVMRDVDLLSSAAP